MMQQTTKGFICFVLCGLLVAGSFVDAQESDPYDCSTLASNSSPAGYVQAVQQAFADENEQLQVFTEQDLQTAMLHLQQFCCEEQSSVETCDEVPPNGKRYAQSPYIFDHLVNIGMRKLDGIEDQCDEFAIDCVFANGYRDHIDRRETVTEIAEDVEGYPPSVIEGHFRSFRGDQGELTDEQLVSNQYFKMCNEARRIRERVAGVRAQAVDPLITKGQGIEGACTALAKSRYAREAAFVRTLMVEKGIMYHTQNLRSYMLEYFTNTRLAGLLEKYATLDGCFTMVLKYVSRTNCCNN